MSEKIEQKKHRILECVAILRENRDECLTRFDTDPIYRGAVLHYLYLMADSCIALAEMTYLTDRYVNFFTDYGFKRLFGEEPNKDLLRDFLDDATIALKTGVSEEEVAALRRESLTGGFSAIALMKPGGYSL